MVRQRILVALATGASLSVSFAAPVHAQAPVQPSGPAPAGPEPIIARPMQGGRSLGARERWGQMSPEDRQRFRSNAERWLQLDPEERKTLRSREDDRRRRIQRETEEAMRNSGLQLEAEKREAYQQRYIQERKRIEKQLRQEIEERRQRELGPVVERLKKEFSQGQANGAAGSTTPTPKKER